MKYDANDTNVPLDEFFLAEAIAAAEDNGLTPCKNTLFKDENGFDCPPDKAAECCAAGALIIAKQARYSKKFGGTATIKARIIGAEQVMYGNDYTEWTADDADDGETLGHAFQLAMRND